MILSVPWLFYGIFAIAVILVVAVLILFFRSSKGKGVMGEYRVKNTLTRLFGKHGVVFNGFICVDESFHNEEDADQQRTVEIDHIVVCDRGVLVIETKNYAGEIYGRVEDREWTQVLGNGNVRNKMHSPVFQNETHCHFVRKIIGGSIPLRSIIVFVNNNTDNIDAAEVVGLSSLSRYLKKLPIVLDRDRIPAIVEKLRAADRSDEISSRQHVRNVRRLVEGVEKGICPRCGGKLVVKKDDSGEYYGCSNYPKCKFKKPL